MTFNFGKYKGQPYESCLDDLKYCKFLKSRCDPAYMNEELLEFVSDLKIDSDELKQIEADLKESKKGIVQFGKYKNVKYEEVPDSYCLWVVKNRQNVDDSTEKINDIFKVRDVEFVNYCLQRLRSKLDS